MPNSLRFVLRLPAKAWRSLLRRALRLSIFTRALYRISGTPVLARLAAWTIEPHGYDADLGTCLCIERSIFSRDLDEIRFRCPTLNWIGIDDYVLGDIQAIWSPQAIQTQTGYLRVNDDDTEAAWRLNEEFASEFLRFCIERFQVGAILSANIDYWHDEGLRRAARAAGIAFLALSKEHVTFPLSHKVDFLDYYGTQHRFRFTGTAVAVYGPSTAAALIECGACSRDQVVVTGSPRLDALNDLDWDERQANTVTLMSYSTPDYFAEQNFAEVLSAFEQVAEMAPGHVEFLIKCKSREDEVCVRKLARSRRVKISRKIDLGRLLKKSRAIVGFNSLTMIEACYTGAKVMVPFWGETRISADALNVHPDRPACRRVIDYPQNKDELRSLLLDAANAKPRPLDPESRADRLAVVREFFYIPTEGSCSQQVADFVSRYISGPAGT